VHVAGKLQVDTAERRAHDALHAKGAFFIRHSELPVCQVTTTVLIAGLDGLAGLTGAP